MYKTYFPKKFFFKSIATITVDDPNSFTIFPTRLGFLKEAELIIPQEVAEEFRRMVKRYTTKR